MPLNIQPMLLWLTHRVYSVRLLCGFALPRSLVHYLVQSDTDIFGSY